MSDFAVWALSATQFAGAEADDDVVALAELIYMSVLHQLAVLDGIDFERLPVRPIDPSHEPAVR